MDRNILKALQLCPLFDGFSNEELYFVFDRVPYRMVRLGKKDPYLLAGDSCCNVDFVVHGEIAVRMSGASGKSVQVCVKTTGALLSTAFIFSDDNTMPVSLECIKPATLFRISPEMFQKMMDDDQRLRINFIRMLSNSCNYMVKKVRMLTLYTVREKVAIFLLQEARRHCSDSFLLTMSRQEIADCFAVQKFSLQRSLKEFADEGIISFDGKHITILKKQDLISVAEA